MLSGEHFYHATTKRIVSVFGTLFNNITIGRHSGNKISNIQRVPISYGPRQKFTSRMNRDLDDNKVAIKLPRMSFEITSIEYDTSTKLNKLNTTLTSGSNNSPRTRNKMFQSVPYTLGMQLNILARNQEDALQILEQILPTFTPEYTVTIKDIEGPGSKTDVPFILNSTSFSDDYEGDYQGRRTLVYTLDFTIRARYAPSTSVTSIIKKVETELADFTNVATSSARSLSSINVSQDSPSADIKTFVTLIDPLDVHTIDLVYKNISLSGIAPLNTITGISIDSGTTADFDRVEDENFSFDINLLSGTSSSSGQGAQFSISANGLTGTTDSVIINNRGQGYIATETITISTSPYNNTNLVLTVDTIFDGTGEEPAGAINTFSITSGNGANSDVAALHTPVFTRNDLVAEPVLDSPNDSPGRHGSEALINVTLDKTGAITGTTISNGGHDYNTSQKIKLSGQTLGESVSGDSPFTDLVMSITSIENKAISGTYEKSGSLNNKPKYIHSTSSGVEISFNGDQWQLIQDSQVLATNGSNSPIYNVPFTDWVVLARDEDSLVFSTSENIDFSAGEIITGNISSGSATIITSNNSRLTVNNLEQAYVEDELITGDSGKIRTVYKTTLAT